MTWLQRIFSREPDPEPSVPFKVHRAALEAAAERERALMAEIHHQGGLIAALGTERAHALVARANAPPQEKREPNGPVRAAFPPYASRMLSGGHADIGAARRRLKTSRPIGPVPGVPAR